MKDTELVISSCKDLKFFNHRERADAIRDSLLEYMDSNRLTPTQMSKIMSLSKMVVLNFLSGKSSVVAYKTLCRMNDFLRSIELD